MKLPRKLFLLIFGAGCCLAVTKPDWKLGTVLDAPTLHQPGGIETPVYSPDGKAITTRPPVQRIALTGTQRLILGTTTAYVVDPGPESGFVTVGHGLLSREIYVCQLGVREQVMYAEHTGKKGEQLTLLDSVGRVCSIKVLRQEQLLATAPAKTQ